LSNVTISPGILSPEFRSGSLEYTATVENNITSITVTPATRDGNATVTVNGNAVVSGSASGPVNLEIGANVIVVKVTAEDGTTERTYIIIVTRLPLLVTVSNAFTPNGDGINDTWSIKSIEDFPGSTVRVFNRTGQVVFTSNGYGIPWDGTFRNTPLPAGTYYYIIDLKNGRSVISGSVIIIR
jgi:gliding motility-associated-like protein